MNVRHSLVSESVHMCRKKKAVGGDFKEKSFFFLDINNIFSHIILCTGTPKSSSSRIGRESEYGIQKSSTSGFLYICGRNGREKLCVYATQKNLFTYMAYRLSISNRNLWNLQGEFALLFFVFISVPYLG